MGNAISSADPGVNIKLNNGYPSEISFKGKGAPLGNNRDNLEIILFGDSIIAGPSIN